jgi:hypothetical protein
VRCISIRRVELEGCRRLVGRVGVAVSISNKHPAQTSCGRLDYVPRVEGVNYGVTESSISPQSHRYGGGGTVFDAGAGARVGICSVFE